MYVLSEPVMFHRYGVTDTPQITHNDVTYIINSHHMEDSVDCFHITQIDHEIRQKTTLFVRMVHPHANVGSFVTQSVEFLYNTKLSYYKNLTGDVVFANFGRAAVVLGDTVAMMYCDKLKQYVWVTASAKNEIPPVTENVNETNKDYNMEEEVARLVDERVAKLINDAKNGEGELYDAVADIITQNLSIRLSEQTHRDYSVETSNLTAKLFMGDDMFSYDTETISTTRD